MEDCENEGKYMKDNTKCKNCGEPNDWYNVSAFCSEECFNEYQDTMDWRLD